MSEIHRPNRHFMLRKDLSKQNEEGATLYRIQATMDSSHANMGDFGGWVENANCIEGNKAWVGGEAEVSTGSIIKGNALVSGNARVINSSRIFMDAKVYGNAVIDNGCVLEGGVVRENAIIKQNASVISKGVVEGNAIISEAVIMGSTVIGGNTVIDSALMVKADKRITKGGELDHTNIYAKTSAKTLEIVVPVEKHYELTSNIDITDSGEILYQIRATKNLEFGTASISKGELGGFVSSINSLKNDAWVGKETLLSNNVKLDGEYISAPYEIKDASDIPVAKVRTKIIQARKSREISEKSPIHLTM